MQRICAWCDRDLGHTGPDSLESRVITHGICDACSQGVLAELAEPLPDFLDRFDVPILLVGADATVHTANRHAAELLGKELADIEGRPSGDVIECVHARTPAGCGNSVHCTTCTIRNTIMETHASGESHAGVLAYPDIQLASERKTMSVQISTEKVGAVILLRIDDMQEQDDARASSG